MTFFNFRTGDVGQWDAQGRLVVIDRVKNIFKLAQGEYIAPEKIEAVLAKHYLVAQVFVYGHSLQAMLVGIVIPDPETILVWAKDNGHGDKTYEELCAHPQVRTTLQKELAVFGKESDLKGFEILKNIYVTPEQFTIDNDLLVSCYTGGARLCVAIGPKVQITYHTLLIFLLDPHFQAQETYCQGKVQRRD